MEKLSSEEVFSLYYEWAQTQDIEYDKEYFLNVKLKDHNFVKQFCNVPYDNGEPIIPKEPNKLQKIITKLNEPVPKKEVVQKPWGPLQDVKYIFYVLFKYIGYAFWGTIWFFIGGIPEFFYYSPITHTISFSSNPDFASFILGCVFSFSMVAPVMIPLCLFMFCRLHPLLCDMWWTYDRPCIYEDTSEAFETFDDIWPKIRAGILISFLLDIGPLLRFLI